MLYGNPSYTIDKKNGENVVWSNETHSQTLGVLNQSLIKPHKHIDCACVWRFPSKEEKHKITADVSHMFAINSTISLI